MLNVSSQINEFAFQGERLWVATSTGLEIYSLKNLQQMTFPYLQVIAGKTIDHITADGFNRLWVSSGYQLFNIDAVNQAMRNFGSEWLVSKFLPAKITRLYDKEELLLIGTDHGVYEYDGERIRFNHFSEKYGESLDIITANDGSQWFASAYGVFRTRFGQQ